MCKSVCGLFPVRRSGTAILHAVFSPFSFLFLFHSVLVQVRLVIYEFTFEINAPTEEKEI